MESLLTHRSPGQPFQGSFRDPDGFVFQQDGIFYRCLRPSAAPAYEKLMRSGLYASLVRDGLLIPHEEIASPPLGETYKILKPDQLPFISYPYEWCFSQLRAAAQVTLEIQRRALRHGLSLKDASAFNIQFHQGQAVLIDTLSFELYQANVPWIGYGQFCRHFLAPLGLTRYRGATFLTWLRSNLDGIPLELADCLLPMSVWLRSPFLALHIRLQRKERVISRGGEASTNCYRLTQPQLEKLLEHLQALTARLSGPTDTTHWSTYYDQHQDYSASAAEAKQQKVKEWLGESRPKIVWDLGANTGAYSRLASDRGAFTVSMEADHGSVERVYREAVTSKRTHLLPLHIDITNASPALGWAHLERLSLAERGPADLVLALALVHHLVIARNIPFGQLIPWLARSGREAIVEFVPREDAQASRLLSVHPGQFHDYTPENFEAALQPSFVVIDKVPLPDSHRILYRLTSRIAATHRIAGELPAKIPVS